VGEEIIKSELIAETLLAMQAASRDYFMWTKGNVLYDHGAEALMQVYAARQLFQLFGPQYPNLTVRLETPTARANHERSRRQHYLVVEDGAAAVPYLPMAIMADKTRTRFTSVPAL